MYKRQVYDLDAFYKTIQRLQPKAGRAIMGYDVRWVGNEKGLGRETEWNATVLTPGIYARSAEHNKRLGVCLLYTSWQFATDFPEAVAENRLSDSRCV